MEKDQTVRERRQWEAAVRRDEDDARDDRGRDLEDPGIAVLRSDAGEDEQRRADGQKDGRLAAPLRNARVGQSLRLSSASR
jgi:hypothetical protein